MSDLQQEHQRETEGLLDNVRELSKELRLQSLVVDSYIPQELQVNSYFAACLIGFSIHLKLGDVIFVLCCAVLCCVVLCCVVLCCVVLC